MNSRQARQVRVGDEVIYAGNLCEVTRIKTGEIAGPHFDLIHVVTGYHFGLTSYRLISLAWKKEVT